jgi:hypothetical protein
MSRKIRNCRARRRSPELVIDAEADGVERIVVHDDTRK